MSIAIIDPLTDSRYRTFIEQHPQATIFHTPEWMQVLADSYRFKSVAYAVLNNDSITGIIPFCETKNITGKKRLVSLPFSDFCNPLFDDSNHFFEAFNAVKNHAQNQKWKYLELRGGDIYFTEEATPYTTIFTHTIDLHLEENTLFSSLRSSTQRNIRKAERAKLEYSFESSYSAVLQFYHLNCMTRREHGVPPQPLTFFKNLYKIVIEKKMGGIALISFNKNIIAAGVYLFFNGYAFYKYGASDKQFQHLRPNDALMWNSIKYCRNRGVKSLNLGRTELHHTGLLQFKRGWNSIESTKKYYRISVPSWLFITDTHQNNIQLFSKIVIKMPIVFLRLLGKIIYPFIG